MKRHAHIRVFRGDAGNQFGRIGIAGNNRLPPGFTFAEGLFSENKGYAVFFAAHRHGTIRNSG
jgi:hypothetical protein